MLFNELTPILKELAQEPVAFCSGFISGALRLNLADDPVKSWLEKQAGFTATNNPNSSSDSNKPKSIDIE